MTLHKESRQTWKNNLSSKHYKKITVAILSILSIAAFLYFFLTSATLSYFDAKAHLHIARQVTNGLTHGFAQLGGVWLPLFHLLTLPFVWVDKLFYTGIAGSIISMAAFVLASLFFFKLAYLLFKDILSSFIALSAFALNPNLLYMQSIPMTESLYMFTFVASSYFLFKWIIKEKHSNLIWAAFFIFLATLTRYDGWGWMAFSTVVIIIVSLKKKYGYSKTEGLLFAFLPLACFGIFIWFVWCYVIFGNPLYFAFGEYSGHQSQVMLYQAGFLPTKGNFLLCAVEYLYVMAANSGIALYLLFVFSLILLFFKLRSKETDKRIALSGILLFPIVFHVVSLYLGHSAILVPKLSKVPAKAIFNARFGIVTLPAIALFAGYLAKGRRWRVVVVAVLILLNLGIMFTTGNIITLRDAKKGWGNGDARPVEKWLSRNYDDGFILTDAFANTCMFIDTKIPIDRFIHQGTNEYWKEARANPQKHVKWVWLKKDDTDRVWKKLKNKIETPIPNLYILSMSHIYPEDRGMNYAIKLANLCSAMFA